MKQIILAVDFSDITPQLLTFTQGFVQNIDAKIHLLHTYNPFFYYEVFSFSSEEIAMLSSAILAGEEKVKNRLKKLCAQYFPEKETTYSVNQGTVTEHIFKKSSELSADHIIIGKKLKKPFPHFYTGSIAATLVKNSACPVFIVPCQPHEL